MTTQDKLTLSTSHPLYPNPPEEEHGWMMIDMEKGNLIVLLSKNKEHLFGKGISNKKPPN